MPRNLAVVRLTEQETQAARQAFGNEIERLMVVCPRCKELGAGGCHNHMDIISALRNMRNRFRFIEA